MSFTFTIPLALAALLIEASVGYPEAVYVRLGHPVTWIGFALAQLERAWNLPHLSNASRRLAGVATLALLLFLCGGLTWGLERGLRESLLGDVAIALLASALLAQRSLYIHVAAVADALESGGLEAGRKAVGMIVGRDAAALDAAGVARAAVESLAENFSDGIVAPAFWIAVLGLPGGVIYKAANTADSMIGHRNERYVDFGWAAARFDDLVNLPASRLAALWLVVAALLLRGDSAQDALRAIARDAGRHRSPNAGWPEAAMAGALGLKLAGPRVYAGKTVDDGFVGEGRRDADARDIRRALSLYRMACAVEIAALAIVAVLVRG